MRVKMDESDEPKVAMSPLIDCVFLLLIFFLVTTMLKKWEKQIPVSLPEATSSLSKQAQDKSFVIGLDRLGNAYDGTQRRPQDGRIVYEPIDDLAVYLQTLASTHGTDVKIEIAADRKTPVQRVIDTFDICQLQGFTRTSVRLRDR